MRSTALAYYFRSILNLLKNLQNPIVIFRLLLRGTGKRGVQVCLRSGEVFFVNSLLDLWVIKETVIDRQYEAASVALQKDWVVVDIGAAMGDYTVWAASQVPQGRVVAIEPHPDSMRMLEENLRINQIQNAVTYEMAVSGMGGPKELNLIGSSSVLHSTAVPIHSGRSTKVATLTLSELLDQAGISICNYLKMDCEGEEYNILFQTPPEVLSRVERICMEVHDGMTRYSRRDMEAYLQANGYQTRLTLNPVHNSLAILFAYRLELEAK